ncbi:hypothetical protein [Catenovulum agarivorans]|uniref:hypothetical protein n=1 Tax=Catenovulum agarivorans TaxID=1172192 RepID=UPI000379F400|nr:hypothetical protein [Catenovulum agarivorans]
MDRLEAMPPLVRAILEDAIWAPSGDNRQNWRFRVKSNSEFEIEIVDDSDWMVYDKEGNATLIALGILCEYIKIAASKYGFTTQETFESLKVKQVSKCSISLTKQSIRQDPLYEQLKIRTVQRKPMGTYPLTGEEKHLLENELAESFSIKWLESDSDKKQVASLMFGNAHTRYAMKEGYEVHSKIIDFSKEGFVKSKTKLPAMSLGISLLWVKLTQLTLSSWPLFHFVEKYMAGTLVPRYLMEYQTAIQSSAHFILLKDEPVKCNQDYIEVGKNLIRFWLKASQLGLGFQPEHTPVIFSELLRNQVQFTQDQRALSNAVKMEAQFRQFVGDEAVNKAVYMGRLGRSDLPSSRSVRKSLAELLI